MHVCTLACNNRIPSLGVSCTDSFIGYSLIEHHLFVPAYSQVFRFDTERYYGFGKSLLVDLKMIKSLTGYIRYLGFLIFALSVRKMNYDHVLNDQAEDLVKSYPRRTAYHEISLSP